ncbi:hypothetical protein N7532_002630 [Penicillium argentinense]|uniref:Major facilitator superfamily (MFS) profile domain-containing protein n=1 Tax=Penicillium argentinense TaxID=1131581 RepID=A0A9W9G1N7_9EURO|nr:uncharacterized protein N7532_002630 [Penicillium argentinense]KAJ5109985.1 hypothetical protein N7532_002630 [Penicillium argentinense]
MIAALNGVDLAGAMLGCGFHVWSSEKFGRKRTMIIGSTILVVDGALCFGAIDLAMFIVGRGIAVMGSGILACVVPMYQAEVSTPETRGVMVSVTGIAYALGYGLAGWLGYACSFMSGSSKYAQYAWRFPLAFQCVFPLVFLLGQKFVPFSPRWLLSQGRRDEAFHVVSSLHKTKADPDNRSAHEEFFLIEKQYELDASHADQSFELFRTAPNRKRALMGLGVGNSISLLLNAVWTSVTM